MKLSLGLSLNEFSSTSISAAAAKALLEYSPTFQYHTLDTGDMVVANKGTGGTTNNLLLYSGRALELGATNDLPIPTFANGYITYFDFATNEFIQVATDGTDYTFNSQTINSILVHHTAFTADDLTALNSNPNLMAKLAMNGSSILELSMTLQGDEQWYPCSEESDAGVLSEVLNPVAGRTIFTTSNASTDITFKAPAGEGLYINGTYYAGQDTTSVTATATGNTIELVESTDGVLTNLDISNKGLNGTVPDFSSNTQLTQVSLYYNNLSGAAPDFSSNQELTTAGLSYNNLSGYAPDFSSNPKLVSIDLSNNHFSGPAPDFSSNPKLSWISLSNNNFSGLIPDFSSNPQLRFVYLYYNNFSGSVQDFSSNPQLAVVYLYDNHFSGPAPDFSSNPKLSWMSLSNNNFSGSVPDFSSNSQLTYLYLDSNNLSGSISDFSSNPQLISVTLNNNDLSDFAGGTIAVTSRFYAHYNALTVTAVDDILQALVDGGTTGSVKIRLEGGTNGVPTNTAAIDTLRSRGCTVTVSGGY